MFFLLDNGDLLIFFLLLVSPVLFFLKKKLHTIVNKFGGFVVEKVTNCKWRVAFLGLDVQLVLATESVVCVMRK